MAVTRRAVSMVTGCNQSEGEVGGWGISIPRTTQSCSIGSAAHRQSLSLQHQI
ncbi:unnamed protein product [Tetraodon nigroviridis]|uniref:(spotted green pufferfish) hypothetical protein n=1 Tax=Tetraodon nigroviridis TaxID=99883 RepID=Q4RPZ2_TETNG|nr:unnamed protein product [Tetraodon nigroviridis]